MDLHDEDPARGLGTRELARRLGTSASQLDRLPDRTNHKETIHQMMTLLKLLDCELESTMGAAVTPRSG